MRLTIDYSSAHTVPRELEGRKEAGRPRADNEHLDGARAHTRSRALWRAAVSCRLSCGHGANL